MSEEVVIVDAKPRLTSEQDEVVRRIHLHLASLIPELGKDYNADISFDDPLDTTKATVTFQGLTPQGNHFIELVANYFNQNN